MSDKKEELRQHALGRLSKEQAQARREVIRLEVADFQIRMSGDWKSEPAVKRSIDRFDQVWNQGCALEDEYDVSDVDCIKDLLADLIHFANLHEKECGGFDVILDSAQRHARAERLGE